MENKENILRVKLIIEADEAIQTIAEVNKALTDLKITMESLGANSGSNSFSFDVDKLLNVVQDKITASVTN